MSFDRFAAIDWSGAKGARHKGIALAVCESGDSAPRLLERERPWSRVEVLHWLRAAAAAPQRTLVGMDFSFAPPIAERGAYLPGEDAPADARGFWAFVDRHCDDDDLGAASFLETSFRRHFYLGAADGTKADYMHYRVCERAFNAAGGGNPSTLYDAIGAAQVAKASFAGMRLLHHLGDGLPVWPFDFAAEPLSGRQSGSSVLVEIYTRLFLKLAGGSGRKLRNIEAVNEALAALGSKPMPIRPCTDHETDVLVAAAGLRRLADHKKFWAPPALTPQLARTEGWTFGVI